MSSGSLTSDDGNTADLALELVPVVGNSQRGLNLAGLDGQLIETFFHQESDDSVRIKDEISSTGVSVSDDRVKTFQLVSLWKHDDIFVLRHDEMLGCFGRYLKFSSWKRFLKFGWSFFCKNSSKRASGLSACRRAGSAISLDRILVIKVLSSSSPTSTFSNISHASLVNRALAQIDRHHSKSSLLVMWYLGRSSETISLEFELLIRIKIPTPIGNSSRWVRYEKDKSSSIWSIVEIRDASVNDTTDKYPFKRPAEAIRTTTNVAIDLSSNSIELITDRNFPCNSSMHMVSQD
ncbi:hypothetical protein OGATHE_000059 [Ogataea polymorpha]|uniref:Uncharacterized protein n=1 Tax=Ogataea polymorpha TaxID=460523 RepID=A0A9P8PWB0_9ASCO|nr:hypothetical protein OGATHE_000059 [Ogataea polymorpha]